VTRSNYHFFGGVSDSNDLKFKISAMVFLLSFLAVGGGMDGFLLFPFRMTAPLFQKNVFKRNKIPPITQERK
jgi:hypothetical protein